MRIIDHQQRIVLLTARNKLLQRRNITIHAKHPVTDDHAVTTLNCSQLLIQHCDVGMVVAVKGSSACQPAID